MNTEKQIWNLLISKGFTQEAAAGIMGNTYAESGNMTNNLQNTGNSRLGMTDAQYTEAVNNGTYTNFVKDSIGYGLCQWTYWSRKQGLLDMAKKNHVSIDDPNMQVEYLIKELKSYGLMNKIVNSKDVREVTKIILTKFEKPASVIGKTDAQVEKVVDTRYKYSISIYKKYKDTLKEDLSVLVGCGVINSPDYWEKNIDSLSNLKELIHNAATSIVTLTQDSRDQTDKDLSTLTKFNVISDTSYWRGHYNDLEYLPALLHNIAEKLTDLEN